MNRILLFLVMLPSGLWARLGADVPQLRALVGARLMLDDRRPVNGLTRPNAQRRQRRFAILLSMFVSLCSGLIYTFAFAMQDERSGLVLYFAIFLLMLSFMLISDFSNVLVDTRDKYIVLPLPISGRTLFLSRILHVGAYLFRIVLPMAIPGAVVLGMQHGWVLALWFFLPVTLLTATSLFLVLGAYLLILRLASQQRFKEVLNYFQIGFSILIFGTYYLLPRLVDQSNFLNFSIDGYPWARFTPPYWLMSLYSWIHPFGAPAWGWGLVALLFPAFCMYLTVRVLAPRFSAILGAMDAVEASDTPAVAKNDARRRKEGIGMRLSRLLNRDPEAQAGFLLVWLQTARSRSFKMRVYPSFATIPVMVVAPMLAKGRTPGEIVSRLGETKMHLVLLYVCTLFLMQTLSTLVISESYKASWIYRASPLREPGAVIAAGFKVILVKFILPFYIVISAVVVTIWGVDAIADVILATVNVTLYGWCLMRLSFRKLPFSEMAEDTGGGSRFLLGLFSLLIGGMLGIAHYLTFDFILLKLLFVALAGIAIWLVSDSVRHTAWSELRARD